jgi:hypothetical protein
LLLEVRNIAPADHLSLHFAKINFGNRNRWALQKLHRSSEQMLELFPPTRVSSANVPEVDLFSKRN